LPIAAVLDGDGSGIFRLDLAAVHRLGFGRDVSRDGLHFLTVAVEDDGMVLARRVGTEGVARVEEVGDLADELAPGYVGRSVFVLAEDSPEGAVKDDVLAGVVGGWVGSHSVEG